MDKKFDVFISHSSQDRDFVNQLARNLESMGMKVWSERDVQLGASLTEEIERGIEQSQHMLLVVSPNSLNSPWANFEVGVVLSKVAHSPEMLVIPVLTQDVDVSLLPFSTKNRISVDAANMNISELSSKISQIFADSRAAHAQK
jgi:hypothetical protein